MYACRAVEPEVRLEGLGSPRDHTFAEKILSAMRKGFRAHVGPEDHKARPS